MSARFKPFTFIKALSSSSQTPAGDRKGEETTLSDPIPRLSSAAVHGNRTFPASPIDFFLELA